jgi:hypothetical protein
MHPLAMSPQHPPRSCTSGKRQPAMRPGDNHVLNLSALAVSTEVNENQQMLFISQRTFATQLHRSAI